MGVNPFLIIVQARLTSQRFPEKMLAPLYGQPLLLWLLGRLATLTLPLVVAIPDTPANAALGALCRRHGFVCHLVSGEEQDVLGRFAHVAALYPTAQHIVRVCGDTPLCDPGVVQGILDYHCAQSWHDYTGLSAEWGDGNDVEVFSRAALLMADDEATAPHEREHVSPYLWGQPRRFTLAHYPCPFDCSHMRTSVDTKDDLNYVSILLARCLRLYGFTFDWRDVWWEVEQDQTLRHAMAQRIMNSAYLAQVGHAESWATLRYQEVSHE